MIELGINTEHVNNLFTLCLYPVQKFDFERSVTKTGVLRACTLVI